MITSHCIRGPRRPSPALARSVFSLSVAVFSASALCLAALPAAAQTASQVTRDSYAPKAVRPAPGGIFLPSGGGLSAPEGAERLHVTPSGLEVSGGLPELAAETARIEARLKDKTVTAAELFAAAGDLEAAYARAGYLLVRVSLPPQTLRNGHPLKLVVTRGFVEAVDTSALPGRVEGHVARLLAPLVGRDDVTRRDLERQLLLAGDTPGLRLRSALKSGSAPGATVIVVEGRHDAITALVGADNGLSDEMGTWAAGLGVNFNSLLGLGEVIYARFAGYPGYENGSVFAHDPRNRQIAAGFVLPFGTTGAWVAMEGVDSRTHATSDQSFTLPDHFQRVTGKIGYHWLRGREANLSSVLALDVSSELQELDLGGSRSDFTRDDMRVVRLTHAADVFFSQVSHLSASATLSLGVDAFGARSATTALPLSRDGATPDFAKLSATATFVQGFQKARLSLAANAQTSFGSALVASEQMSLGGSQWLSAYDLGDIAGDSALMGRAELAFQQSLPLPEALSLPGSGTGLGAALSPYVFAAGGVVTLSDPTAVEEEVTRAAAFGAGLRLALSETDSPRSGAFVLEYAHGTADNAVPEDRINFSFHASF